MIYCNPKRNKMIFQDTVCKLCNTDALACTCKPWCYHLTNSQSANTEKYGKVELHD